MSTLQCGVVIWSKSEKRIKTCGATATHSLIFSGDYLFAVCPRHKTRLVKAGMP